VCAIALICLGLGASVPPGLAAQQQPPRAAQDEFVPIDQLPPGDQLPAARFLIAAYAVAWLAVAAYLWSIWQRLARVERELAEVRRRTASSAPGAVPRRDRDGGR
jgi:CcmD family protein